MQSKTSISTAKIIFFVILICATLITALFFFYGQQKTTQTTSLSNNNGTVFPVGRSIKSFNLSTVTAQKFSPDNFHNHWTLVFFGFTHCASICPTTLDMLKNVYVKLHPDYPTLQVVFISLDPDRDSPQQLKNYMHSFHDDFIAVTGKIQEIRKLQSQLGIFSGRDEETEGNNYQLQHTSSILLINPEGKWTGLFRYGMNPNEFIQAFKESLKRLSS